MHAIAEASDKDTLPKGISLAESQYVNLDHGSSRVGILLNNNTDQAITLPSKTVICQLGIANLVNKLVAPQSEYEDEEIDPDLLEDPDIDYNAFKAYAAQASASAGDGVLRWMNLLLVLPRQLKRMMAHGYLKKLICPG